MSVRPAISIAIATYDRPASLARCLESLLAQRATRPFEIVVVDNHPQSGLTKPLYEKFSGIRWMEEPVAGLSVARNRAIHHARGEVIVTTDDDVEAPPGWLETLAAPLFEDGSLAAVTGNCLPLKTETPAEILFEAYGGLRHGDSPATFDARWLGRWRFRMPPLWAIGTTANAAFRSQTLARIQSFEPLLGAGSAAGAWEDLYAFYRILQAGGIIRYQPKAELRHAHRESIAGLARQLTGYRRGEGAFLALVWRRHQEWRVFAQALYWIPKWRITQVAGEVLRRLRGSSKFSFRLIAAECRAYFDGPRTVREVWPPLGQAPADSDERPQHQFMDPQTPSGG
jgi:glycosyltransferase involved in cell wall biosynthesis